jgi:hypothetical protein
VCAAQTSFRGALKRIGLDKTVAHQAERIGYMPENILAKTLARNPKEAC